MLEIILIIIKNWLNKLHLLKEGMESRRHHHEWPQTKEDIDQNDFVPMDKPNVSTYILYSEFVLHLVTTADN